MKIKLTICLLAFLNFYDAQENITYQKPSAEILKLADYERPPAVLMNNKKDWVVFTYRSTYKTLDDLNQQEMKLGGLRINPVTNIASTTTYFNNLKIRKFSDKNEVQVKNLPTGAKIAYVQFSPDEKKLTFTNTTNKGVELWMVDLESATAKKITGDILNANLGTPYLWYNDSQSLLIRTLPQNRPALIDSGKDLPTGPIVSTADGKVSQNRTYQDLLKNPQDEKNFETLVTSEVFNVDLNGNLKKVMNQDMYTGLSFSPDGNYLLSSVIKKPFSYIVPLSRFPMATTVYDTKGNTVKVVNEIPLNEIMPKGFSSVRTGKREMSWRSDVPATLVFTEALDGGDQYKTAEYRDEIFTWEAPFTAAPKSFFKIKQRFEDVDWTNDHYALVSEEWYDTRNTKTFLVDLNNGNSKVIDDRNSQDVYSDPGEFNTVKNQYGRSVVDLKGGKAYLIGDGFTKDGQHPFIDEMDIQSLKKKRIYTSNLKGAKESIVDILNPSKGEILTTQESSSQYPNFYKKNIKSNKAEAVTHFANPFESIKDVHKEVITYKRNDGVTLTGTLYLPANYDRKAKKEKLPLLIWAYPREYKDKNTAGQSTQNDNDFTFPYYGSFVYWVTKGYAVLDNAAFPIIGEGKTEPNDTFITQLVADADAAINAVDQLGYIDKKKVAVGGTLMERL
ncbi:Uncharacterised protein [Chryseobacterium jejuense]|uniref:S9 family peptidase n=1 Tax=Chryseobacterium jejuense TaxID=445960 RepID=A0A2X2XM31_CHRJE|nr:Uncharacterised protein [Chryseobacterium jejuense]